LQEQLAECQNIFPLYEFYYFNQFYRFIEKEETSKKYAGDRTNLMILQLEERMERYRINGVQFHQTLAQMMPNKQHLNISNLQFPLYEKS